MTGKVKFLAIILLALLMNGCATTYVPVSWGQGERVRQLSHSDLMLVTLFDRYDPERKTLRVAGESFDEVMMPGEVQFHLGAYRPDTKLIYRNLYHDYGNQELRDMVLHELAHHIWFTYMSPNQRRSWLLHLVDNPSPLQQMVRRSYPPNADLNSEDFAFTVQYARPVDIKELARLNIITAAEEEAILEELNRRENPAAPYPPALAAVLKKQGAATLNEGVEP